MPFPKKLIELAPEGYTGKTIAHIVTKANLKNQPELNLKEGDTINIVEPVESVDTVQKAVSKSVPRTKKNAELAGKIDSEITPASTVKGNAKAAKVIADANSADVVYENLTGEFFLTENLVLLSVNGDRKKVITHTF